MASIVRLSPCTSQATAGPSSSRSTSASGTQPLSRRTDEARRTDAYARCLAGKRGVRVELFAVPAAPAGEQSERDRHLHMRAVAPGSDMAFHRYGRARLRIAHQLRTARHTVAAERGQADELPAPG